MTDKQPHDDYDSPWKDILEAYFQEFIAFFFPQVYEDIDWEKGYEFLDKELQQITRDAESGRRYVDKLARVWLKIGKEQWALVHTDIQARPEKGFDERMFMYNYRLYDRFRRFAASFAVISDKGGWRPGRFAQSLWKCELDFRFPVVRLSDYAKDREALKQSRNPFATVVLAHLRTQETAGDKASRRREKMALIRMLYEKEYSRQDIIHLFRFIDWIMHLPEAEERLIWKELSELEEERNMPYVTSVERIGYKRGMEEGIEKGIEKGMEKGVHQGVETGESNMLAQMIVGKFGMTSDKALSLIQHLNSDERSELARNLFGFETSEAFFDWLRKRTKGGTEQ